MKLWNKVKGWLTGSKETTDEDKEWSNLKAQKVKKKAKGLNAKKKRNKERKARKQGNIN
tara:strand:+ start:370 stop:546 length:177 start_codon:yes stop_codon:yes gene_type:complete